MTSSVVSPSFLLLYLIGGRKSTFLRSFCSLTVFGVGNSEYIPAECPALCILPIFIALDLSFGIRGNGPWADIFGAKLYLPTDFAIKI